MTAECSHIGENVQRCKAKKKRRMALKELLACTAGNLFFFFFFFFSFGSVMGHPWPFCLSYGGLGLSDLWGQLGGEHDSRPSRGVLVAIPPSDAPYWAVITGPQSRYWRNIGGDGDGKTGTGRRRRRGQRDGDRGQAGKSLRWLRRQRSRSWLYAAQPPQLLLTAVTLYIECCITPKHAANGDVKLGRVNSNSNNRVDTYLLHSTNYY